MEAYWIYSHVGLWVVVSLQAALLFSLLRLVGRLHVRMGPTGALASDRGPAVGAALLRNVDQARVLKVPELVFPRSKDLLMVFLSSGCQTCEDLIPSLIAFVRRNRKDLELLLATPLEWERELRHKFRGVDAAFVTAHGFSEVLDVPGTPFAILADAKGIVRSKEIVNHIEHLESLLNSRQSGYATLDEFLETIHTPAKAIGERT